MLVPPPNRPPILRYFPSEGGVMSDLVVIVCRTVSQAEEVRRQLSNLQVEYRVALDDVAIVNRTEAGEIRSTIS